MLEGCIAQYHHIMSIPCFYKIDVINPHLQFHKSMRVSLISFDLQWVSWLRIIKKLVNKLSTEDLGTLKYLYLRIPLEIESTFQANIPCQR